MKRRKSYRNAKRRLHRRNKKKALQAADCSGDSDSDSDGA
jgi:hypothetical protein